MLTYLTTFFSSSTGINNPAEIPGIVRWYDFSDAASVSLVGSDISQINDKSGLNNHATGAVGFRPEYITNAINGLNVGRSTGGKILSAPLFDVTATGLHAFVQTAKKSLEQLGVAFNVIGEVSSKPDLVIRTKDTKKKLLNKGFDHFKKQNKRSF